MTTQTESIDLAASELMNEFRLRLIDWMEAEEVSNSSFCYDCNIDRNGLRRFIKGSGGISAQTMFKFAMVSGISIDRGAEQIARLSKRVNELERELGQ